MFQPHFGDQFITLCKAVGITDLGEEQHLEIMEISICPVYDYHRIYIRLYINY